VRVLNNLGRGYSTDVRVLNNLGRG